MMAGSDMFGYMESILDAHYRTIGGSMEVFGLKVDNITRKPDYVECVINQAQFGQ